MKNKMEADMEKPDLSIIAPMYNEEEVLGIFFEEIKKVLDKIDGLEYEIICVNDGSSDKTLDKLRFFAEQDKRIKAISFSRNFGKEKAMYAGLEHCSGKAAIVIDVDLQDPVELIEIFIQKWKEGYETVYGVRINRKTDTFFKRFTANLFYKAFNKMSQVPVYKNGGDFRLIDRKVIDAIKEIKDNKLFMKYIFNWPGYKSCSVGFVRQKRAAGTTKWNYWKLWNFALDGISAATTLPLRIWTYIGVFISLLAFLRGGYIIARTLISGIDLPGYASLTAAILFLGGIQLIALGVLGEYLGRVLEETRRRPMYLIAEKVNFDA